MIHFTCPCGKALQAREDYVGQTTRCPKCGRELLIPAEEGLQAEPPPPGRRDRAWDDQAGAPATSGLALAGMILGLVSLIGTLFTGVPAVILGVLGLRAVGRSAGRLRSKGFALTGIVGGAIGILLFVPLLMFVGFPLMQRFQEGPNKRTESNDLKQMALALHSFNDANGSLPPAANCDAQGKPLLSWRVAILPYIEQINLYNQFHMDEPWDSPNNIRLLPLMPKTYALPGDSTAQPGYTYYRVFVGDHALFPPPRPAAGFGPQPAAGFGPQLSSGRGLWQIPDGMSNTIMVAEAATAVPWTKPDELPFDPDGPLPPLGGHYSDGFLVGLADGSIRFISRNVTEKTLRNAVQIDDGNVLGSDW